MQFRTAVTWHEEEGEWICPHSHILLLGSCFADAVGKWLQQRMPQQQICINPFGTLYNPNNIAIALRYLSSETHVIPTHTYIQGRDGMWHNLLFSSIVSAPTLHECQENVALALSRGRAALSAADHIFITLSTDHVYRWIHGDKHEHIIAANCHKEPARYFAEEVLSIDQMVGELSVALHEIQQVPSLCNAASGAQSKRIVFTLSPYRYLKQGMHESALSKARLMLSIEQLCQRFHCAKYFPAYEIVMDELRDYRFYAPDMIHPSPVAVEYIGRRLMEWTFTPEAKMFSQQYQAIRQDFAHRLLHPDSPQAAQFIMQREERKRHFCETYNIEGLEIPPPPVTNDEL